MTRDLRDPQKLGELYLEMRGLGVSIERAATMPAEKYEDGPFMSSNPAQHHMVDFFQNLPEDHGDLSE